MSTVNENLEINLIESLQNYKFYEKSLYSHVISIDFMFRYRSFYGITYTDTYTKIYIQGPL